MLPRNRNLRLALGIAFIVVALVLIFFALRALVGCVSGAFGGGNDTQKADRATGTQEYTAEMAEPVQIDLVMIGDILQHSGVFESGYQDDGTRNYDHIFANIGSELAGADIKVVNQETLLGGEAFEFSGYPTFNGPQEMGDAEVNAGFNVILRATNHALDYGYEGLHSEMSYWHTQHPDIAVIGAIDPEDTSASLDDMYVFEKDGFKVALLNYTYDLNGFEDPKNAVSLLTEEHVRKTVTAADEMADMVVVFPHWGEEYNLEPVQSQYDMAKVFMDCGADVIIGGHPHVIEPVEVLTASDGRKVPCFWSVGNFVSTQTDDENMVGGMAKVTLLKDGEGKCSVTAASFIPTITHKGTGSDMTAYFLRDWTDDLAATNYFWANGTDNTSLTVEAANQFCSQVLGSVFDATTQQVSFGKDAFVPGPEETSTSSQTGTTTDTSASDDGDTKEDTSDDLEESQDLQEDDDSLDLAA